MPPVTKKLKPIRLQQDDGVLLRAITLFLLLSMCIKIKKNCKCDETKLETFASTLNTGHITKVAEHSSSMRPCYKGGVEACCDS